jgi:hypothetical protein
MKTFFNNIGIFALGAFTVMGATLALASYDTNWIESGKVLSASKLKANIDALSSAVTSLNTSVASVNTKVTALDKNNNSKADVAENSERLTGLTAADLSASSGGGNQSALVLVGNVNCPSGFTKQYFENGAVLVTPNTNPAIVFFEHKSGFWGGGGNANAVTGHTVANVSTTVCIKN